MGDTRGKLADGGHFLALHKLHLRLLEFGVEALGLGKLPQQGGFGLVALAAGAWWSLVGPALMSVLLLRVSGVTLLERDIGKRRPGYAEYIRRTNAFFPGPRRP